jgi:exopolysaccharide biosynthesis polyprenyl glycosylphosphotransferase
MELVALTYASPRPQPVSTLNPLDTDLDASPLHPFALHAVALPVEHADGRRNTRRSPVLEVLKREQTYRRCLATADALVATFALLLAAAIEGMTISGWVLAVAPVTIVIAKVQGLYDRDDQLIRKSSLSEVRSVLQYSALAGILMYLSWVVLTSAHSRGGMRLFILLASTIWIGTLVTRAVARHLARQLTPTERCLVLGDAERSAPLAARLAEVPGVEYIGTVPQRRIDGSPEEMAALVRATHAHRLVIVQSGGDEDAKMLEMIRAAKSVGVRISLMPTVMTAVGGFGVFDELDGITLLGVPRFGLSHSSAVLKRAFDIIVASLLLIAAAPAMAVIAIAIRLDSPGRALFRQVRIGRGGKPFEILKLRSMVDGADELKDGLLHLNEAGGGLFKISADPRVTRLGAYLRTAHIDELPQLINVIRGEMSLVGPRPLVASEAAAVVDIDRTRLQLTPGITGPWQIRGPIRTPLEDMAKLDYKYLSNWSLWQDLEILLQTAARVFSRSGH